GGSAANAGLNAAQRLTSTSLLVSRTRALASARTQILTLDAQITAQGGANAPIALIRQRGALTTQVQQLEGQVTQLRALGGQALETAEATLTNRMRELADLESQATAPGLAPSARAARLNDGAMQQARQNVRA